MVKRISILCKSLIFRPSPFEERFANVFYLVTSLKMNGRETGPKITESFKITGFIFTMLIISSTNVKNFCSLTITRDTKSTVRIFSP